MKKRMLTMLLALVMIVSALPFAVMADETPCNHSGYGYYLETSQSTCKDQGAVHFFCNNCGTNYWSQTKPLADHTYGTDSKCTVCGTVCSKHSYSPEVRVEATCEENGSVTKTCTECGYKKTVKTLKAPGHKFTESVDGLVATCTVDGYTAHKKCSVCGEKNSDYAVIEAKGHELKTVEDKSATCTADGIFKQKCEICEYEKEEIRECTGHSHKDVPAKAPSCTVAGHSAYKKCTVCGSETGKRPVEPTGHTYVNGQCKDCGVPVADHTGSTSDGTCTHANTSSYITSPNCTVVGYEIIACEDCHAELSRVITEATGHTEKTIRKAPSCTEDGFVKVVCEVCNAQISNTLLEHFSHNYENGICTRCGGANSSKYTPDFQDYFIVGGTAY